MTPLLLIAWVALFIATYRVGRHKGHEFLGVAFGVLAPVLGLIILAICPMTVAKTGLSPGVHTRCGDSGGG
jgi:uncharacterized membrane protein HdeD (DUF308 family)